MSEFRMVSPLLDGYTVEKTVLTQRDRTWYSVRHTASGECFILKHISVPASDAQVRALILSGICENEHDVLAYYTGLVSGMKRELELGKELAETGCFSGAVDFQIEQKTNGIGYDIYILQPLQVPLNELINRNGMTHLRAVNLGIDLCDAIIACRNSGYLFANLNPDSIFLVPSGKFMLGDLGLIPLKDLEYAGIPESYIGSFSAPELFDITTPPNLTIDLYSLGMVLYRIYNGNHGPFEDENTNEAMADKLRLSGKPLPTPIYADYELAGIINKACSHRIANRYTSPEQLREALILYLQRNQIPDSLIVPPLVVDPEPVVEEEVDLSNEEPLRMVDADELDAAFKASFAPSSENAGGDVPDLSEAETQENAQPAEAPLSITETPLPSEEDAPVLIVNLPEAEQSVPTPVKDSTQEAQTPTTEIKDRTPEVKPAQQVAAPSEPADSVKESKPAEGSTTAAVTDNDLLTANTVSGPKMPTGNLKMKKKGKRSRRRENLVLEIPMDPPSSAEDSQDDSDPVTIQVGDATPESTRVDRSADAPKEAAATCEPTAKPESVKQPDQSPASDDSEQTAKSVEKKQEEATDLKEEKAPAEPTEPTSPTSDSMDIDELIASVNEVVGSPDYEEYPASGDDEADSSSLTMHVAPITSGYYDPYHDDRHNSSHNDREEKKKSKWLPLTIIAILTVALVGVIAFLLNNYYVNITELKLIDHSTEALTVELVTPDAQECFIVTCTDNYGTSYPRTIDGNSYSFTGLRENTAYTVTVIASEYHRLRSGKSYTMTVKTPGTTKITEFTARRGTQVGDVVLSLVSEGPSPEEWQYTYTDSSGVVSGPFPFTNQTALVTNLKEDSTYIFSIQAPRDLYLSGETTIEYTLLPIVTVHTLHITEISGSSVSIAWDYKDNAPQEWTVTCEGGDFSKSITTSDLKATFTDLPDFARDYVFTVTALGVDEPATLTLSANPIILEDLKAEYMEDGTVSVTWSTPAGSPEFGWNLTYNTVGSFHIPYVVRSDSENMTASSAVLENLIPNAEYQITLHLTKDDAALPLFGQTTTTITTPAAKAFAAYDINPAPVYDKDSSNVSLWLCPEKEEWTYKDLENLRTSFTKDENIAICIQVDSISASDETVDLLYVIRDENGQVVEDETQEFTWDSLWFERRHANTIPLPKKEGETTSTPGSYTLEIYINGMLLTQRDFIIA